MNKEIRQDWSKDIEELRAFFNSVTLPKKPIKLSSHETIANARLFITTNLATAKVNNGNITHLPYLERLKALKQILYA